MCSMRGMTRGAANACKVADSENGPKKIDRPELRFQR